MVYAKRMIKYLGRIVLFTTMVVTFSVPLSVSAETGSTVELLTAPEPIPCCIGFCKNSHDENQGTQKFFLGSYFDDIKSAAVALSGGVFADKQELVNALTSKGKRTIFERAKQQIAALLLNLAAEDVTPSNGKCQLDEANSITSNACGENLSVGDAVDEVLIEIFGDLSAQQDALNCADDLNNGIGVVIGKTCAPGSSDNEGGSCVSR